MAHLFDKFKSLAASRIARWVGVPMILAAGAASLLSQSQTSPPLVNLSAEPLYARGARAKPTLTLALSVEFPTVGAQYVSTAGAITDTYAPSASNPYIGYFHAASCYLYSNANRYFYRTGPATNLSCGGNGFSGNFMNWATSSAIDILRLGLTGGDRVVDDANLTVLQRAVLPNANVSNNFWNGSNFPTKILTPAQASGAVPSTLYGSHSGNIFVSNCLNRVHFGTEINNFGGCERPGNNSNLGAADGTYLPRAKGPVANGALPNSPATVTCTTGENQWCAFPTNVGMYEVFYGVGSNWLRFPMSASDFGVTCDNNMTGSFNDPAPGYGKICRYRSYTGPWQADTGQITSGLSPDNFFYSRVQVCESDGSGNLTDPRADLCLRYPAGNYKPIGNLQKYSDNIRVAAFGYLNDSSYNRYGGVLRAPMKYVGPRSYDTNFALSQSVNPVQEWNPSDGRFIANPDNSLSPNSGANSNRPNLPISGVVNYLNQFGRTGAFGQYKTYDPVGELYYESLRYLQGLPITSGNSIDTSPTLNLNDTMRDGFPVSTSWIDPHPAIAGMTDYSCIKNNIVAIGDVNTHADNYIPGNTRTSGGDSSRGPTSTSVWYDGDTNQPNAYLWTRVVGAFEEARTAQTYPDGNGTTRNVSNFNGANGMTTPLEDYSPHSNNSYYMAGLAYWANTHDIRGTGWIGTGAAPRPGMRVKTYILDVNEYGNQSTTTTRRRNQFYMTGKYGGFDDDALRDRVRPGVGNPFISMAASAGASGAYALVPSNSASAAYVVNNNIGWERATAVDADREAKSYFLSSSASAVLGALDQIFAEINAQARSIAGGAISTQRLTTNTGYIYQAQFDPTDWSGDLLPVRIAASGNAVVVGDPTQPEGGNTSPWRNAASAPVGAAGVLDDRNIASSPRSIYVGYGSGASFDTSAFRWDRIPTSIQNELRLPAYPASAASDAATVGEARLNYLRGDRSQESTGIFRRRGSRLGDIVNSGVVYSGTPAATFPGATYATFRSNYASRTKALFVGANDGMLHAFNADTGVELFGYIPSWMTPKLSALTHPSYIHQSFQDSTPVVGEVNVGGYTSGEPESWRTVLVGGSGGGGQGVFALNITDPSSWAYTPSTEPGNVNVMWEFSHRDDPAMGNVIGRPQLLKLNVGTSTAPSYRWFAVVASGVNNNAADGYASTGAPALFFLRLDKPRAAVWSEGKNQIATGGNNYFKITFPQYTSTIANGMIGFSVRLGTAGEVSYVYAGDLQGNLWKLDMSAYQTGTTTSIDTFSYFKSASDVALPMYSALDSLGNRQPISMEPSLVFGANRSIIVSFGTGKFLESSDNAGPYRAQSVYSLLDNNTRTLDSSSPAAAISGRGRLMAGTTTSAAVSIPDFVWGRPSIDNSTGVSPLRSGWYFDYYTSASTGERQISNFAVLSGKLVFGTVIPAPNSCSNGDGNLFIIDVRSGDGSTTASTVGILGEPFLVQVGASTLTISDTTGRRREQARFQIILQGSGGSAAPPSLGLDVVTWPGRLSWREISNYQELRNTP